MHFTQAQRDAWMAETRDSPFNRWLRARTTGRDGLLDLELLRAVAAEYGVDARKYAHLNAGQQRMNVGNRLRRLVPKEVYGSSAPLFPKGRIPIKAQPCPTSPPDTRWPFMRTASVTELLRMQAAAIEELRDRNVARTSNAPLGDYAEHLFARAFGWALTSNSATSYDAMSDDGVRFQIKARRLRSNAVGERQLGVMRGLPDGNFDYLAAVLFDREFGVHRAVIVPHATVVSRAVHIKHVNGWRFMLEDTVWGIEGVQDVTQAIRSAAASLDKSSLGAVRSVAQSFMSNLLGRVRAPGRGRRVGEAD